MHAGRSGGGAAQRWSGGALLAVGLALGCAHLQPPEEGGPGWWRVTTRHFELRTDLPRDQAAEQAAQLERLHRALLAAGHQIGEEDVTPHAPFRVVAQRRLDGAQRWSTGPEPWAFLDAEVGDARYPVGRLLAPWEDEAVVLESGSPLVESDGLVRVLASRLGAPFPEVLPGWLKLGMQRFLATGRATDAELVVGRLNHGLTPRAVSDVATLRGPGDTAARASPQTSFLLVHLLRTSHADGLVRFTRSLRSGQPEEAAFADAFPGLTDAVLDVALPELRNHPRDALLRFPLEGPVKPLAVEPLDAAEVHALWAVLYPGRQSAELDRALRLDPRNASARLLQIRALPTSQRLAPLLELRSQQPHDPRPARAIAELSEAATALRLDQVSFLAAAQPWDRSWRAAEIRLLWQLGRLAEALSAARALAGLGRPLVSELALLAQLEGRSGHCREARAAAVRAAAAVTRDATLLPGPVSREISQLLTRACAP